jgi:hypothetical protein
MSLVITREEDSGLSVFQRTADRDNLDAEPPAAESLKEAKTVIAISVALLPRSRIGVPAVIYHLVRLPCTLEQIGHTERNCPSFQIRAVK